jgi:hypothetical protein
MATIRGHEDLRERKILGFDGMGRALVDFGEQGLRPYNLTVTSTGTVKAIPVEEPKNTVDQEDGPRHSPTLAERLQGVDQTL